MADTTHSFELGSAGAQSLLNSVAAGTASQLGVDYLNALLDSVANHLSVDCAFVTRRVPGKPNFVKSVTYWGKDGETEISYNLAGSPCEVVYQGSRLIIPCDLSIRFPEEEDEGVEGYLGAPLYNVEGVVDGHLAIFTDVPFENSKEYEAVLSIFAARAQAELRRMDLEEELKQKKEIAEKATEAKALFLAVMGHEIKTPANSLQGMIDLLAETDLSEKQSQYLQIMRESGQMMISLLNDLLDLSKSESGSLTLEESPFNLPETIQNCLGMFQGTAAQKSNSLNIILSESSHCVVMGDSLRLKQILSNLISNALKFTHSGKVDIHIKLTEDSQNIWRLSGQVNDTGIGFGDIDPESVFNLYQQASSSTARKYGGTGLGLAICRRLCRAMGGDIHAQTNKAGGATFDFNIALKPVDEKKLSNQSSSENQPKTLNILVAEDNPLNRMLLVAMLEKLGHQITEVEDGLQAIHASKSEMFDLILMDTEMPELDGIEATRIIQADNNCTHPPIVAVSGYGKQSLLEKYKDLEIADIITKPIDAQELSNLIDRLIS